jgi:hypothetical protein
MKTKAFKSVEEWLSSKPDEETIQKVLAIVNKGVVSQMKRELNGKKTELRKVERTIDSMKKIGLPVGDAVEKRISELKKELSDLQKDIPEPTRKKEMS